MSASTVPTTAAPTPAQQRFDAMYMTSAELLRYVGISRGAVSQAVKAGRLPVGISLSGDLMMIWERDHIVPILDAWIAARSATAAWKNFDATKATNTSAATNT